jgi:hypothetical protein
MLVTGGFEWVLPQVPNLTTEVYDPATGAWDVLSPLGSTPFEVHQSDYTHSFVLPQPVGSSDVLMLGEPGVPVLLSTTGSQRWTVRSTPRPGSEQWNQDRLAGGGSWESPTAPNWSASSAMLPIRLTDNEWGYHNGSVLVTGGGLGSTHRDSVDVYDPVSDTWRSPIRTGTAREYPSTVILPDGRMLIVNGKESNAGVRRAGYVDPRNGFAYSVGSSETAEMRGYHNVALLLPDGRVLVGGGRDLVQAESPEKTNFRYYSPGTSPGPARSSRRLLRVSPSDRTLPSPPPGPGPPRRR